MKSQEWKSNKITINSVEELIELGLNNTLSVEQYTLIIQSCKPFLGIFLNEYQNTIEMAKVLKEFWDKWKHTNEKPIFIDNIID
jgi:hypothetical protein